MTNNPEKHLKCPICQTYYDNTQEICSECGWSLIYYYQARKSRILGEQRELKVYHQQVEYWAKNAWQQLQQLKASLNFSSQLSQMDKKIESVYVELDTRISALESSTNILEKPLENRANDIAKQQKVLFPELLLLQSQVKSLQTALDEKKKLQDSDNLVEGTVSRQDEEEFDTSLSLNETLESGKEVEELPQASLNLSEEENDLVYSYHHDSNKLISYRIEVNATEESVEESCIGGTKAILERNKGGSYWLIPLQDRNYLVPKVNPRLTQYNIKTAKVLFDCEGYQEGKSSNFELIKPAKVKAKGEKWELSEPGLLRFKLIEEKK